MPPRRPMHLHGLIFQRGKRTGIQRTVLACLLLWSGQATADTVQAAVAANFAGAVHQLAPLFHASSGHQLTVSLGSSGKLYAQIRNGAPYDLLLAAEVNSAEKLVAEGWADGDTLFTYARGRLVLWSADPARVDKRGDILKTDQVSRLAIANPKTAPYGRAAVETLTALNLLEPLRSRFVTGENIAQTWQFVASGNAPLGFVALGQLMALPPRGRGSYWVVPAELHHPIDQAAVVLHNARSAAAARAFLDFLKSPEAVAIIRRLGYETPGVP